MESKVTSDHLAATKFASRRKHIQTSKKLGCPVTFTVKKIITFPRFKACNRTKWEKTTISKSLKEKITKGEDVIGKLQYVTCFPKEGWSFLFSSLFIFTLTILCHEMSIINFNKVEFVLHLQRICNCGR